MLPEGPEQNATRYANVANPTLLKRMLELGADLNTLQAKIVGGSLPSVTFGTARRVWATVTSRHTISFLNRNGFASYRVKLAESMAENWCFKPMTGAPGGNNSSGTDASKFAAAQVCGRALGGPPMARPRRPPERIPAARRIPCKRRTVPDPDHPWLVRCDLPLGRQPFGRRHESFPAARFSGRTPCLPTVRGFRDGACLKGCSRSGAALQNSRPRSLGAGQCFKARIAAVSLGSQNVAAALDLMKKARIPVRMQEKPAEHAAEKLCSTPTMAPHGAGELGEGRFEFMDTADGY